MTDMRCPSCGAVETFRVKPAVAWTVQMVGWPWNRRLECVPHTVGQCVVCLRCDWPYVVTPSGPFVKRSHAQPANGQPLPASGKRVVDPLSQLMGTVNALPDEPE